MPSSNNRNLFGIYCAETEEIIATEKFLLILYCADDCSFFGMKLYSGKEEKRLCAVCERSCPDETTRFAYFTDTGDIQSNDLNMRNLLGQIYMPADLNDSVRRESFFISHTDMVLPSVSEAGIKECLTKWRMLSSLTATPDNFRFSLCTERTEYIFFIMPKDTNIYCGASFNIPLENGLLGAGQYFRIRNYQDNTAPFCGFYCNLARARVVPENTCLPPEICSNGTCVQTPLGLLWGVKRAAEDEIVLQGRGDDEYRYCRFSHADERYLPISLDEIVE